MNETVILDTSYLETLPPEWGIDLLPEIRREISSSNYKIIVLDDDPTGTQTARDLPVLTTWSSDALEEELKSSYPAFFILTNSRSLPEDEACTLALQIGDAIRAASDAIGVRVVIISRSDSTLRGHFPAEVDATAKSLSKEALPYLVIPSFIEGGRYTINDVHYVREGSKLIPAAQTAFAGDAAFGFSHSNLKYYIQEKTKGAIQAEDVKSISLDDLRLGGPDRVTELLSSIAPAKACIVNSVSYRDMEVLVAALIEVEKQGKEFLYRTAASFVRTRTGLDETGGLLSKDELTSSSEYGGLFVIGSYVAKTSNQVSTMFKQTDITPIEVDVKRLLKPDQREIEITRVTEKASTVLRSGKDAAIYTSRELVTGKDAVSSLEIGQIVSNSLIEIVKHIDVQPHYLVAKGGVTSSDIATKALGVRRAMIIGQALPGVPAWNLGYETRYPGMTYIIFPGNVGDDDALARIQQKLKRTRTILY
ncbi:MAG: hypothetical protein HKP41_19100 [Desulfobacterales bacterium]|nr:hypothetical protein [Desulfobacterales bacterium]